MFLEEHSEKTILKLGSIKASGKALLGGRKFHSLQI